MDFLPSLLTYALALGIAAAIPGPGVTALVWQALAGGMRPAAAFVLGMVLGDLVYLTLAVAGLAALAELFAGALLAIKVLGGVYLIYLAIRLWRAGPAVVRLEGGGQRGLIASTLAGFTLTLGNPKSIIFYMALLPTVVDLGGIGVTQWLMLCLATVLVLLVTLVPYAFLAHRARRMFGQSSALVRLNRWAAGFIGAAGVLILGEAATAVARRS